MEYNLKIKWRYKQKLEEMKSRVKTEKCIDKKDNRKNKN